MGVPYGKEREAEWGEIRKDGEQIVFIYCYILHKAF